MLRGLDSNDLRLIMDRVGRETIVAPTEAFKYEIVTAQSVGYHSSDRIKRLQGRLSIMLQVAEEMENGRD